jgi:hypothetical protein
MGLRAAPCLADRLAHFVLVTTLCSA